jgi:predicted nucleic acid-binding protein
MIEGAIKTNVTGGRIYDALIAETARAAGADVLLTFNVRHFAGIAGDMAVVEPGTLAL